MAAGKMSASSNRPGKQPVRDARFDLDALLNDDSRGGYELYALLAPWIVRSAESAAAMRSQNRFFKMHVDEEITKYLSREFAPLWRRTNLALARKAFTQRPLPLTESGKKNPDVVKAHEEGMQNWNSIIDEIDLFRHETRAVFGSGLAQQVIKNTNELINADAVDPLFIFTSMDRQSAAERAALVGKYQFSFGLSVHFYLAARNDTCEICSAEPNPARRICRPAGMLRAICGPIFAPVDAGNKTARRMIWVGSRDCIEQNCVEWNKISQQPVSGCSKPAILAKYMMRHGGVSPPFDVNQIRRVIREVLYDRYFTDDSYEGDEAGAAARIDARRHSLVWLKTHPACPSGRSLQELLGLSKEKMTHAEEDVARDVEAARRLMLAEQQITTEKLCGDFDMLLSRDHALKAANVSSVEQADELCPGLGGVVKAIVQRSVGGKRLEHPLDEPITRLVISAASIALGDLVAQNTLAGLARPSPHALAFVSGLWVGAVDDGLRGESGRSDDTEEFQAPNLPSMASISTHANADARALLFSTPADWASVLMAAHAFDALDPDSISFEGEDGATPQWVCSVGGVAIRGPFDLPCGSATVHCFGTHATRRAAAIACSPTQRAAAIHMFASARAFELAVAGSSFECPLRGAGPGTSR